MKYLILLLFTASIYAAEPIKEGDLAPFNGVIFTTEEGRELVENDKKLIKLEQLQVKYEEKIGLQDQRIDLLKNHISDMEQLSPWSRHTWFFIGFVAGGITFYYSSKAIKNASK